MKRIYLLLLASLLAACAPSAVPTLPASLVISTSIPREEITPAPAWTSLSGTTPIVARAVIEQVATPTESPVVSTCLLESIEPAEGTVIPKHSLVNLKWQSAKEAASYTVLLEHPGGLQERFAAPGTGLTLRLKASSEAALYRWNVLLYDAKDQLICISETHSFTLYPEPVVPSPTTGP